MLLKLDLKKVYDRIHWAFVLDTLRDLRLSNHIVFLIMKCITTSSIKVS